MSRLNELRDAVLFSLKQGGEQAVLAEALTTHGKALARLKQTHVAKTTLDQAVEIAQTAGNPDRGGIAAITAIEELSDHLSVDALHNYYRTAETLLSNSQNLSIKTRLGECARRVLSVALAEANADGINQQTPYRWSPVSLSILKYFAMKAT